MKNVWKIFQRDMMRVRNNVIALVVIIGISVVPCLYAWFNIAASWEYRSYQPLPAYSLPDFCYFVKKDYESVTICHQNVIQFSTREPLPDYSSSSSSWLTICIPARSSTSEALSLSSTRKII